MVGQREYEQATEGLDDFGRRLQTMVEGLLSAESLPVNQVTYRVKTRQSAEGKVRAHPDKYRSIADLTDLLGVRINPIFLTRWMTSPRSSNASMTLTMRTPWTSGQRWM